jgi:hypothetical protein
MKHENPGWMEDLSSLLSMLLGHLCLAKGFGFLLLIFPSVTHVNYLSGSV